MPSPERRRRDAAPALERAVAKPKSQVREYAEALAVALLLALVIRTFVVQAFKIPSGSMLPTLQIGDHLLVNKFLYGARLEIPLTDVSLGRLPGLRKPRLGRPPAPRLHQAGDRGRGADDRGAREAGLHRR